MSLKEQIEGINNLLTNMYHKETRLSTLLLGLGFRDDQIDTLRHHHLEQLVKVFISVLKENIGSKSDGERLYKIVNCRFGLDGESTETLQTLGDQLGVSRERIRQLEKKVLRKFRSPVFKKHLEAQLSKVSSELITTSSTEATKNE